MTRLTSLVFAPVLASQGLALSVRFSSPGSGAKGIKRARNERKRLAGSFLVPQSAQSVAMTER